MRLKILAVFLTTSVAIDGAVVSGTVSDAVNGTGISDARVRLSGTIAEKAFEKYTSTDASGVFRLEVEPGSFHISASAGGFTAPRVANSVDVVIQDAKDHAEVRLQLSRTVTITGMIMDGGTKRPVPNMPVAARRASYLRGHRQLWIESEGVRTTKDGVFRLENLPPGDYFFEINGLPAVKGDERYVPINGYSRVMWPAGDPDVAAAVTALGGSESSVGTITIVKSVIPKVTVQVNSPECDKSMAFNVSLNQTMGASRFARAQFTTTCGTATVLTNIAPGKYDIVAMERTGNEQMGLAGALTVEVDSRPVEIDVPVRSAIQFSGSLEVAGNEGAERQPEAPQVPHPFGKVRIKLWPRGTKDNSSLISVLPAFPPTEVSKGNFTASCYVPPGNAIDVITLGLPEGYFVRDVFYNGAKLDDNAFELNPYATGQNLKVVVSNKPASVEGTVKTESGAVLVGARIVVVPNPPVGNSGYPNKIIEAASDSKGRFRIPTLKPGKYRILAVEASQKDRLEEPGRLLSMAQRATEFEVQPNEVRSLALRIVTP